MKFLAALATAAAFTVSTSGVGTAGSLAQPEVSPEVFVEPAPVGSAGSLGGSGVLLVLGAALAAAALASSSGI